LPDLKIERIIEGRVGLGVKTLFKLQKQGIETKPRGGCSDARLI
jgi:hypothetical protein